jgi:hypothetical protein
MLFITCEHYLNEAHFQDEENVFKECFICFEKGSNENSILYLREINTLNYVKICNCDGIVHLYCFQKWYNLYKKCPICREIMDKENEENDYLHNYRNISVIIQMFFIHKILFFLKIFGLFWSFYIFYDFFLFTNKIADEYSSYN